MYNNPTIDYDFGLIELASEIEFTNKIKAIALPSIGDDSTTAGIMCLVSGWGVTSNPAESRNFLRGAEVPLVEQEKCVAAYAKVNRTITSRMICAGFEQGGKDGEFTPN